MVHMMLRQKNAVIAFQKKYKLKADGIAGPAVHTKLDSVTAQKNPATTNKAVEKYPTLKVGSKGTAVVDMQNKLKKAGVYNGKSSGTFIQHTNNWESHDLKFDLENNTSQIDVFVLTTYKTETEFTFKDLQISIR
jgi:peptidoglycan hydrolase-like protein with peptidoglycan-binding domain